MQSIMDTIDTLRTQALCPHIDPKSAVDMLKRANKLDAKGFTSGNKDSDISEAKLAWEKRFNKKLDSPETQEEVFRVVAEMRKKELEAKARRENPPTRRSGSRRKK